MWWPFFTVELTLLEDKKGTNAVCLSCKHAPIFSVGEKYKAYLLKQNKHNQDVMAYVIGIIII